METIEELALTNYPICMTPNMGDNGENDVNELEREAVIEGYNEANKKLLIAVELIEYFVNRVEEGTIISKTTYKLYKDFLNSLK